ncbi:unnamed protein product [Somion occarium]|uniref:Uncharacterized protein n=1 Tax=Somion occarium TaxID=3059160 RepID=A0ABP1CPY0_9APHY
MRCILSIVFHLLLATSLVLGYPFSSEKPTRKTDDLMSSLADRLSTLTFQRVPGRIASRFSGDWSYPDYALWERLHGGETGTFGDFISPIVTDDPTADDNGRSEEPEN